MTADDFESLRLRLPLDDPDRHDLDTAADEAFAHLAPGYPDTSSPVDFAASVAAGYVTPADWSPNGGHDADCAYVGGIGPCTCAADCEPQFAPRRTKAQTTDVETGGRL